ncbi:hypothetical protein JI58_03595 [Marinosulfonomonas sp. PRT-SC04]|nr:hypothetical protein JI58_03595 [Marinosulfonomonas sp. PRT-SC04]
MAELGQRLEAVNARVRTMMPSGICTPQLISVVIAGVIEWQLGAFVNPEIRGNILKSQMKELVRPRRHIKKLRDATQK